MPLQKKRIHLGYATILPLGSVTSQNILDLEKKLGDHFNITGKNVPNEQFFELRCKQYENVFTLRIQVVGEVQRALPEPLHSITVLIGNDGTHSEMAPIYNRCLECIGSIVELPRIVATKEATIRLLYGRVSEVPAFQYLWEKILKQDNKRLDAFGCNENSKIAGGGIRFLIAPKPIKVECSEIAQADIKIESFFRDPSYIFVEAKYNWVTGTQYETIKQFTDSNILNVDYVIENTENSVKSFIGEEIL